ncbi:anthranilate phosphoribosyltransferase [Saccharomonospora sp. CUA-673]|uniref:anthranilate phosphoribosyltransferase n=1 Tax=Saccharomonospora sp. CUA-673 TaxID=1904969 RepID=UPI0009655895|nr:anthranilate phosphoribosyltransferase [Saccharomonospora sp. CUA-673]OLT46983.1 anthranilate phosphoribosyltransferase [Saccharomonospora sp. CUA-673]
MTDEPTWPTVLSRLIERADLSESETAWAMDQIMSDAASPSQIGGFAVGLRAKGETPAEIAGMAYAMLTHARTLDIDFRAVDIVGTGGDRSGSVNISTMSSLVAAAAGAPVVKHGSRAASSKSGAADVLETLGVAITMSAADVLRCIREVGIGFCFAPAFHPALRYAGATRRELGVPTTFNMLGPLSNPAQPSASLIGCAYADKTRVLAEVFAQRGHDVLLVRGDDGLDEITNTTTTTAWVISGGRIHETMIDPRALDVPLSTEADLKGGSPEVNAKVVQELVSGKSGPVRDAVLLNAAGALAAYEGFPGFADSGDLTAELRTQLARVAEAVDSGAAAELLQRWIDFSATVSSES